MLAGTGLSEEAWNGNVSGSDDLAFKFGKLVNDRAETGKKLRTTAPRAAVTSRSSVKSQKNIRVFQRRGTDVKGGDSFSSKYKPDTPQERSAVLERVMEETPTGHEDFGEWFLRWLALVSQTEIARGKPLVVMTRAPSELKVELVMQTATLADKFPVIREITDTWKHSGRNFSTPGHSHKSMPSEVGVGSAESVASDPGPSISMVSGWSSLRLPAVGLVQGQRKRQTLTLLVERQRQANHDTRQIWPARQG